MKKITFFLTCLFFASFVNAQTASTATSSITSSAATLTKSEDISKVLEFNEENHDFGKIPYGKPVEFDVAIKNISPDSVKIETADSINYRMYVEFKAPVSDTAMMIDSLTRHFLRPVTIEKQNP